MNDQLPPPLDFDALRARGIDAAQQASCNIWTDYNLHDPGVTLLEQTAFALTEVAFMGDHAVRDLLTDQDGKTDFQRLALFSARRVLQGRPVTMGDMAAYLSDLEGVERVFAQQSARTCLVDLMIIPSEDALTGSDREKLIGRVRRGFERVRLLATAIDEINIAAPRAIRIEATVDLTAFSDPDQVAAEMIDRVRHLLRGTDADGAAWGEGITRDDTYIDPLALRPRLLANASANTQLDTILSAIKEIEGVSKVSEFDLVDAQTGQSIQTQIQRLDSYYTPQDLDDGLLEGLHFGLAGTKVQLNPNAIQDEVRRIEAARYASSSSRTDRQDWDVLGNGRHRALAPADIDLMLPALYKRKAHDTLGDYRKISNQHVGAVAKPLSEIPNNFVSERDVDFNDPADIRRRIEMLDYLIGLQGEQMPNDTALHGYRSARQKAQWRVDWRTGYLRALPYFNCYHGTANTKFGTAARIRHLADLRCPQNEGSTLVSLDAGADVPEGHVDPDTLILPTRPLDAFITRNDDAAPLDAEALEIVAPWVKDRKTTPALFQRAAMSEAYVVMRNRFSDWELLFNPGNGQRLYPCISNRNREVVANWGNRLRNTFVALNQDAETLDIIEAVTLRGKGRLMPGAVAYAVLPNWTLRTNDAAFRRHVEDVILNIAPAHVYVKPVWLGPKAHQQVIELQQNKAALNSQTHATLLNLLQQEPE